MRQSRLRSTFGVILLAVVVTTATLGVRPASAQTERLYAALVRSRGYVVGGPLAGSGLHYLSGDTTWTHVGWNHPIVFGVAVDPTDPNVIFLAAGNGALRSLDGGKTWRITTGWRVTEVLDVDINPANTAEVYIATSYGIWRTDDRGENWIQADDGISEKYTSAIRIDRADPSIVIAGTVRGVFRSGDKGASWTRVSDPEYIVDIQQSRSDPKIWIGASHDGGVVLSDDGGAYWRSATGDIDGASLYAVAIDPRDARRMATVGFDSGLYVTSDGGASWEHRTGNLPGCVALTVVTDPPENPGPCLYEVVFDPGRAGSMLVATVESGLFRSNDLGRTWRYAGMNGSVVYDLVYARRPR